MSILSALKPVFSKAGMAKVGKALWSKPAKITYATLGVGAVSTAAGIFAYKKYNKPAETQTNSQQSDANQQNVQEGRQKMEVVKKQKEKDSKKEIETLNNEKFKKPEKTKEKEETEETEEVKKEEVKKEESENKQSKSTYTVKPGDNVWNIAKAQLKEAHKNDPSYKPSNAEIAKLTNELIKINNLHYEPDNYVVIIQPGQKLKLSA